MRRREFIAGLAGAVAAWPERGGVSSTHPPELRLPRGRAWSKKVVLQCKMRGQTSSSKIELMPRLGWSAPLTRSIEVKDGPTLRTLNDARAYMLDHLPEDAQARHSWQKAAELLLAAADGLDDVGAATGQVELALFLQLPKD